MTSKAKLASIICHPQKGARLTVRIMTTAALNIRDYGTTNFEFVAAIFRAVATAIKREICTGPPRCDTVL